MIPNDLMEFLKFALVVALHIVVWTIISDAPGWAISMFSAGMGFISVYEDRLQKSKGKAK